MSQETTVHWLSLRIRIACGAAFILGCFAPPYAPKVSLAAPEASQYDQQFLLVEEGFLMKSSPLTRQGERRAYAEGVVYTVRDGDNLERIAQNFSISKETIQWANALTKDSKPINPGQQLVILPVDGVLHSVKQGQTLIGIADIYDVPVDKITDQNQLKGRIILPGQELIIPGGKPIVAKPVIVAAKPLPGAPAAPPKGKQVAQAPPAREAQYTEAPTAGVLQKPCSAICFLTQNFHPGHFALDLQEKGGGPVYASEAGKIIRADYGWQGGYGNVIEIDHGNELVTLYGHNKEHYVKVGDHVERGQLIGWMGNTGLVYGATGIHTHFEVRYKGIKKNPYLYIQE